MLLDMLGILIGFIAIMLLFSLLVTALVHGAQATLNLRFRNLKAVINQFFSNMDFVEYSVTEKLLNQIESRFPNGLYATAIPLNIPGNRLRLTNIGKQELMDIISTTHDISVEEKEQLKSRVQTHFETLEEIMSQRFKQWMHQISIILGFIICFIFQLNCFSLLSDLNQDSAFRHQSLMLANTLSQDSTNEQYSPSQMPASQELQSEISALNFKITPQLWNEYYFSLQVSTLSHWLGIIFSSILISLGAPFWFNRLKDMASLRDKLSKA